MFVALLACLLARSCQVCKVADVTLASQEPLGEYYEAGELGGTYIGGVEGE